MVWQGAICHHSFRHERYKSERKAAMIKVRKNDATVLPPAKRICDRFDCCYSIFCARFNSSEYFQGRMANYSEDGLYFECESPFQPGTSVFIRIQKKLAADAAGDVKEGFRSLALGEVKWCKELSTEGSTYYGVGVKYYKPDY